MGQYQIKKFLDEFGKYQDKVLAWRQERLWINSNVTSYNSQGKVEKNKFHVFSLGYRRRRIGFQGN